MEHSPAGLEVEDVRSGKRGSLYRAGEVNFKLTEAVSLKFFL